METNGTKEGELPTTFRREGAVVCDRCTTAVASVSLPGEYVSRHDNARQNWHSEVCDVETMLLPASAMTFRCGCWFGQYPILPDTSGVYSKSIGELVALGWRFEEKIVEMKDFGLFHEMDSENDHDANVAPEVIEYLKTMVEVTDLSELLPAVRFIASNRAFLCDITASIDFHLPAIPHRLI